MLVRFLHWYVYYPCGRMKEGWDIHKHNRTKPRINATCRTIQIFTFSLTLSLSLFLPFHLFLHSSFASFYLTFVSSSRVYEDEPRLLTTLSFISPTIVTFRNEPYTLRDWGQFYHIYHLTLFSEGSRSNKFIRNWKHCELESIKNILKNMHKSCM